MDTHQIMSVFRSALRDKTRVPFAVRIIILGEDVYVEVKTRGYRKPAGQRVLIAAFEYNNNESGFTTYIDRDEASFMVLIDCKGLIDEDRLGTLAWVAAMLINAYNAAIRGLLFEEEFEGRSASVL